MRGIFLKIADPTGVRVPPTIYIGDKRGVVKFADVGKLKRYFKSRYDGVLNSGTNIFCSCS